MATLKLTEAQKKGILYGVPAVAVLVLWVSLFLLPQRRALTELRPQVHNLRSQVKELRAGLQQLPAMEAELTRLASQFEELPTALLPPEEQLPLLLDEIGQTARRTGIRLGVAVPQSDVGKLQPGPSGFLELPIVIAIVGGYHEMGTFLDQLEHSKSLLRVREMLMYHDPESTNVFRHMALILFQAYLVPKSEKENVG